MYNYCLRDPYESFDLMSFLNVLCSYDFPIKVNYALAVILKKGNEGAPLFEYSYSNKNYDFETDTAFQLKMIF